jgi:glycosyltransferase involved in cell wall biosynthesis
MISFILPIRNEVQSIEKTIQSICSQTIDNDFEIIVADGMSTDGTSEIIEGYSKNDERIHIINNPDRIVSTGFNRALSRAKGNIIIRVDGHCEIELDYIQKCLGCLEKINADCVGGATEHVASGLVGKSIKLAQSSFFGVGGVSFRKNIEKGQYVDTLAFGAYKREVFDQLGGYDEELVRNQDDEFNFRMIQNDMKIWLDPSIKSTYTPRNSFMSLFKQYFQYGFYKVRVMQKRKGLASWRHLVPIVFVLSLLIGFFLFIIKSDPFFLFLVGMPYLLFSLICTLLEIFKSPKHVFSLTLIPLTFFILHFSYGLGFLLGLVYFWNKWNDTGSKDYHFNHEKFLAGLPR